MTDKPSVSRDESVCSYVHGVVNYLQHRDFMYDVSRDKSPPDHSSISGQSDLKAATFLILLDEVSMTY